MEADRRAIARILGKIGRLTAGRLVQRGEEVMKSWLMTTLMSLCLIGSVAAQQGGGGIGGAGGAGRVGGGGAGAAGGGGSTFDPTGGFNLSQQMGQAPLGNAGRTTGTAGTGTVSPSNLFAATYANPIALGLTTATSGTTFRSGATAGFGQPVFGNLTTGTGTGTGIGTGLGAGGAAGGRTIGTTTGLGGGVSVNTNLGRRGNLGTAVGGRGGIGANNLGTVRPQAIVHYTAQPNFPMPTTAATQLQTDLRAMLDRSTRIAKPADIEVAVEDRQVVLRGKVASEREARVVEGMIRLTPGVRSVRNELEFPLPIDTVEEE